MSFNDVADNAAMPPGTVYLEDLQKDQDAIILHPQPSRDPNDPLNWSRTSKIVNFAFVCTYTLLVYALLNVQTVMWGDLNTEVGISYTILNDSYAAGCAALTVGGLIMIPFALKFGRRFVYCASLLVQCGMAINYGFTSGTTTLMTSNVISCIVGALSEVLVQMTVADVFFVHERGLMNSIYYCVAIVGSNLADIAAGYITGGSLGWPWVWWFLTIFIGILFFAFVLFYRETSFIRDPVVLQPGDNGVTAVDADEATDSKDEEEKPPGMNLSDREVRSPATQRPEGQQTKIYVDHSIPLKTYRERLKPWIHSPGSFLYYSRHVYQPFLVMWYIPSVAYMALLNGASNTATIICITTYSDYMLSPPYNFTEVGIGNIGVAAFIGTALAALTLGPLSDRMIIWLSKRNGGVYEPEMRLWLIAASIPIFALGMLLYGVGLARGLPWGVIAFALGLVGFATTAPASFSLTYLTDAYTEIIADCLVAIVFVKFLIATILVFALTPWIALDGLQNMMIIVSIMFIAIYCGTGILIVYGKGMRIRAAPHYYAFADRQIIRI